MKGKFLIFVMAILPMIAVAQFPGYIGGSTYENSNTTTGFQGEQSFGAAAMERSTVWKNTGTYSLKIKYAKTDGPAPASQGGGYRVEHFHNYPKIRTDITWFRQWWYIPSATYADDPAPEILWQYHKGSGSPPVSLQVRNGQLYFLVFYQNDTLKLGAVPKDAGWELVWHLVPSTGSNGLLEIWMNGVKRFTRTGPNTNGTVEQYFKTGIYKWNWDPSWSFQPQSTSTLREFYVDDYAFGQEGVTTFADITLIPQTPPPPVNQPPVVTINENRTLSNEKTRGMISGSATDSDGTIASYSWAQISGPNTATIVSPTSASSAVENLIPGIYVFRLTVTDDDGATTTGDSQVVVKQKFITTATIKPRISGN